MKDKDLIGALESIIVRCREGAKGTDWLPTIADIAERALKKVRSDPTTPSAGLDLEAEARMVLKALANLHLSPLAMASIRLARHVLAHPAPAVGLALRYLNAATEPLTLEKGSVYHEFYHDPEGSIPGAYNANYYLWCIVKARAALASVNPANTASEA